MCGSRAAAGREGALDEEEADTNGKEQGSLQPLRCVPLDAAHDKRLARSPCGWRNLRGRVQF